MVPLPEIVHAESKNPFPEHTAFNRDTYVEVEPNAEYYICIKSDHPAMVIAEILVDGKPLGYSCRLSTLAVAFHKMGHLGLKEWHFI
jgi:hypothetical protein